MIKNIIKKITPQFLLTSYHYCLSFLGAFLYGFPSKKLVVIGITGTSGKSSVVEMTSKIFEQAGFKTASLSSIKIKIGEKEETNNLKMTMPGRFKIQKFLRDALKAGCQYAVLEVTSEGIKQYRHKFIFFEAVVFTNLSKEHIESHKGFENYRKAKIKLFKHCQKTHIINTDDKNSDYFWDVPAKIKIEFGIKDKNILPKNFNLLGEFNLYNAITACKIALWQNIPIDICQKALNKIEKIPGRLEIISQDPLVVIDYAHTPTQLKEVYKTIKNYQLSATNYKLQTINYKMICLLGSCGGGRDKWKRPIMGKIAKKYCDKIIITNEDPYDENPIDIINQVTQDIAAEKILDRKEAIKKAVQLAEPKDAVIITGKGAEPWMCVKNGKKIPWDDRQIAKEELKNKVFTK